MSKVTLFHRTYCSCIEYLVSLFILYLHLIKSLAHDNSICFFPYWDLMVDNHLLTKNLLTPFPHLSWIGQTLPDDIN